MPTLKLKKGEIKVPAGLVIRMADRPQEQARLPVPPYRRRAGSDVRGPPARAGGHR